MAKCDKKMVLVVACVIALLLLATGVEVVLVPWFRGKNTSQQHRDDAPENAVDVGEGSDASNVTGDALGGGRALLRAAEWTGRDGVATQRASPPEPGRVPTDVFSRTGNNAIIITPPPRGRKDDPSPSGSRLQKRPRARRIPNDARITHGHR